VIDALIAGRIHGTPTARTASTGKPFATAKVRVANVIAFDKDAIAGLLALSDRDSAALAGELTPKVWTDKDGTARPSLDLLAHGVLTEYHVSRKRQAVKGEAV
jgi:hypothetical protein